MKSGRGWSLVKGSVVGVESGEWGVGSGEWGEEGKGGKKGGGWNMELGGKKGMAGVMDGFMDGWMTLVGWGDGGKGRRNHCCRKDPLQIVKGNVSTGLARTVAVWMRVWQGRKQMGSGMCSAVLGISVGKNDGHQFEGRR